LGREFVSGPGGLEGGWRALGRGLKGAWKEAGDLERCLGY